MCVTRVAGETVTPGRTDQRRAHGPPCFQQSIAGAAQFHLAAHAGRQYLPSTICLLGIDVPSPADLFRAKEPVPNRDSALCFGHRHPALIEAAHRQLDRLTLTSRTFHKDKRAVFVERLAALTHLPRADIACGRRALTASTFLYPARSCTWLERKFSASV